MIGILYNNYLKMISQCSLCENFKGKRKHGLFLFPFEIDKTYQSHFM